MKIERNLLVHFNRKSTVEEFQNIFFGMVAMAFSPTLRTMPRESLRGIGSKIVGSSNHDTISLSILEDGLMLYDGFDDLDWYINSGEYADYDILTVDEFIEQYKLNAKKLLCPFGGSEINDCADCVYAGDYHFVDGECVRRDD